MHHVLSLNGSPLQTKILEISFFSPFIFQHPIVFFYSLSLCPEGQLSFFTRHSYFHVLKRLEYMTVNVKQQVQTPPVYHPERLLSLMHVTPWM